MLKAGKNSENWAIFVPEVIDLSRSPGVRSKMPPHLKMNLRAYRRHPENFML